MKLLHLNHRQLIPALIRHQYTLDGRRHSAGGIRMMKSLSKMDITSVNPKHCIS